MSHIDNSPNRQNTRLAAYIDANVPVLLTGAPGTAKTATIEALCAERGMTLVVVVASAQDPTTILGIPMPSEDRKRTEPTTPHWVTALNDADAAGLPTCLFLDELGSVPQIVAATLLTVVQNRRADGWTLPASTRIVAAMNPPDSGVNGQTLQPAMANRWLHISWSPDVESWRAWASGEPVSLSIPPRENVTPGATLRDVADFIGAMPDMLLSMPTGVANRGGAWASPRSWTNGAAAADALGEDWYYGIHDAVGKVPADAFRAWRATRDVPTTAELLDGTKTLPTRPEAFRTAVNALADNVTTATLARTLEVLRAGVIIDAGLVAEATIRIARAGHGAGIAPLVADLKSHGIDFAALASRAVEQNS